MSLSIPYRLANGPGNPPDAAKFMANYDWLTALIGGNFLVNGGFENWAAGTSFTNPANATVIADSWAIVKSGTSLSTTDVTRDSGTIDSGTYSAKFNITAGGSSNSIVGMSQTIVNASQYASQSMIFGLKVKCGTASKARLKFYDGTTTSYSSYHTGGGTFELLTVSVVMAASPSVLTVSLEITSDFTGAVYADSGFVYVIPPNMTSTAQAALAFLPFRAGFLSLMGGIMQGTIDMNSNQLNNAYVNGLNGSFLGSFRNRIINGEFGIDQRNAGASVTVNNNNIFGPDRWAGNAPASNGVFTMQRTAGSATGTGFSHYLRCTTTTQSSPIAGGAYSIRQYIEGYLVRDLMFGTSTAKTITISFWVRSSRAGTWSGAVSNSARDRDYPFSYTINSANTWEQKSVTIAGDTTGTWLSAIATSGMKIWFCLGSISGNLSAAGAWEAGSNIIGVTGTEDIISHNGATWDITGVQLEIGSNATNYEYRPHDVNRTLCERYYEKSWLTETAAATATNTGRIYLSAAQIATTTVLSASYKFRTKKMAAPTMTYYDGSATSGSWGWISTAGSATSRTTTSNFANENGFSVSQTAALEYLGLGHFTADAEL